MFDPLFASRFHTNLYLTWYINKSYYCYYTNNLGTLHVVTAFILLNGRFAVGTRFGVGE